MSTDQIRQGAVFFFKDFEFKDGETGDKLIVVLNKEYDPKKDLIICKTTSRQKFRNFQQGCNKKFNYFCFFKNQTPFKKHTWLLLDDLYSIEASKFLNARFQKKLNKIGDIEFSLLKGLIKCIKSLEDIEEIFLREII